MRERRVCCRFMGFVNDYTIYTLTIALIPVVCSLWLLIIDFALAAVLTSPRKSLIEYFLCPSADVSQSSPEHVLDNDTIYSATTTQRGVILCDANADEMEW